MVFDPGDESADDDQGVSDTAIPTFSQVEQGKQEREPKGEEKKESSKKKAPKKRKRRRTRKRSTAQKILGIGMIIILLGTIGYLGYLYSQVKDVRQPDVPQNQLHYKYYGEKSNIGDMWEYPPRDVDFRREKAYEKIGTEYIKKVIPIYQEEKVYVNDIKQLAEVPPYFGQFHIGSFKTINDMERGTLESLAEKRMQEVLDFRRIQLNDLVEYEPYGHKIDGQKAYYSEYTGYTPRGADEPGYIEGRDVRVVLLTWVYQPDMSGKYFFGVSVVNIENDGSLFVPNNIEDLTTWNKITSLIPRVSVEN